MGQAGHRRLQLHPRLFVSPMGQNQETPEVPSPSKSAIVTKTVPSPLTKLQIMGQSLSWKGECLGELAVGGNALMVEGLHSGRGGKSSNTEPRQGVLGNGTFNHPSGWSLSLLSCHSPHFTLP